MQRNTVNIMVKWTRCKLVEWWRSNETASPTKKWGTVLHQTGNCHQSQDNTQTTTQSTGWKMVSNPDIVQYCISEGKGLDMVLSFLLVLRYYLVLRQVHEFFHATTVSICFVLKASCLIVLQVLSAEWYFFSEPRCRISQIWQVLFTFMSFTMAYYCHVLYSWSW